MNTVLGALSVPAPEASGPCPPKESSKLASGGAGVGAGRLAGGIARASEAAGSRDPRDVVQMRPESKAGQTTEDSADTPGLKKGFPFQRHPWQCCKRGVT